MVPAAGCYDSHLLPLGAGNSDGSAEKRNTAINDRDLCGAAGAETGIMQRSGTLRHTAYWKRQSGHLLGMRCGTAENTGGAPAPMLNDISVLRTAARPYQGLVLGKGWLHPAVQTTGAGRVSMAALRI